MDYAFQACTKFTKKATLKPGMDPEAAHLELTKFWNGIMLQVTEATGNTQVRNVYSILLQQARNHTQTLRWLDEPEVFYSNSAARKGKRRMPWFGLAAFVLLLGLVIWFAVPNKAHNVYYAGILGVALGLFLVQFIMLLAAVSAAPTINIRTEQRVNPEKIYAGLLKMAQEIDSQADTLVAMLSEQLPIGDDVDLSLAQELIRLPKDLTTQEVRSAVDRFLVRNQVEQVFYSGKNQELFMVLPAEKEMTLEPALVKDEKILSMGVACIPGEG